MNQQHFQAVVESRIERTLELLGVKGKEYARGGDRLSNFKRAASIKRETVEKAWLGIWSKHLVSILDMIDDVQAGCSPAPFAQWQEKIGDTIVYMILLEAIEEERQLNAGCCAEQTAPHKGKKK